MDNDVKKIKFKPVLVEIGLENLYFPNKELAYKYLHDMELSLSFALNESIALIEDRDFTLEPIRFITDTDKEFGESDLFLDLYDMYKQGLNEQGEK